jgi:hypothetical protein
VLVNGESISVADTRTGLGLANVGESASVTSAHVPVTGAETAVPGSTTNVFAREIDWIPFVIGGLGLAIIFVLIIAALTRRRSIPG